MPRDFDAGRVRLVPRGSRDSVVGDDCGGRPHAFMGMEQLCTWRISGEFGAGEVVAWLDCRAIGL